VGEGCQTTFFKVRGFVHLIIPGLRIPGFSKYVSPPPPPHKKLVVPRGEKKKEGHKTMKEEKGKLSNEGESG
jgi:hypothetical protein